MSYKNEVLSQQASLKVLKSLLERYELALRNANTEEARTLVEGEVLSELANALAQFKFTKLGLGSGLSAASTVYEYDKFSLKLEHMYVLLNEALDAVNEQLAANNRMVSLLEKKMRLVKQKIAACKYLTLATMKKFYGSSFNDSSVLSPETSANIDTVAGVATLPLSSSQSIKVNQLAIATGSNGSAGTSAFANNWQLENLLDDLDETYFEYSSVNQTTILNLRADFFSSVTLNCVRIKVLPDGNGNYPNLSAVRTSLDEFAPTYDINNGWIVLYFSPQTTSFCELGFTSGLEDSTGRSRILVETVQFFSNKYESEAVIQSVDFSIPKKYYYGAFNIDADSLGEHSFFIKQKDLKQITNDFPLDGNSGFSWKLLFSRNSFVNKELQSVVTTKLVRTLTSKFGVPSIVIPKTELELVAYQPKVASVGFKNKAITKPEEANTYLLDINLVDYGIDPLDIQVWNKDFAENFTFLRQGTIEAGSVWKWGEGNDRILTLESPGGEISVNILPEYLQLEERLDGYYCKLQLPASPDKNTHVVYYPSRTEQETVSVHVSHFNSFVNLGYTNIDISSVRVVAADGTKFNRVDSIYDIESNTDFYIEADSGKLWLPDWVQEPLITGPYLVSFKAARLKTLEKSRFDLVFENSQVWGLRLDKSIPIQTGTFLLDNSVELVRQDNRIQIINGLIINGLFSSSTQFFALPVRGIIEGLVSLEAGSILSSVTNLPVEGELEEVPFENGYREFLGITNVTDVTQETAGTFNVVRFYLSAREEWHSGGLVNFIGDNEGLFVDKVEEPGANGEYAITAAGEVIVYTTNNVVPAGISICYGVHNPEYDSTNKYSVDYKNSRVYIDPRGFVNFDTAKKITVRYSELFAEYDVVKYLPTTVNDNEIEINVNDITKANNIVNVVSVKNSTVSSAGEYSTPVIYSVNVGVR